MTLQDDYAHLRQLADELPFDLIEEVRGLISYAGEEAALVLGEGHGQRDRLAGLVLELENTCSLLSHELGGLANFFRGFGGG